MAKIVVRRLIDGAVRTGTLDDLDAGVADPVWIDVSEPDEAALAAVGERFPLHPLAVDDCLHYLQRPKVDVYGDSSFLIWLVPHLDDADRVQTDELDAFLGERHLITVHAAPIEPLSRVADNAGDYLGRGVEWVLHAVLDQAVDGMFPLVDELSDELEELEDLMLADARTDQLERLYAGKRSLLQLHKIAGPERDALRTLARLDQFVAEEAYLYYEDVGDHLARFADSVDTYRDVASGTMDIYLSSVSNRMNMIMKQLTVIATIFMPLTLISGIYGMNFRYMPVLAWRWGYHAVLVVMALLVVAMMWFFKRRKWW